MKIIRKNIDKSTLELNIPKSLSIPENDNIEILQGQSIIIVGANGSGKSRFCVQTEIQNETIVHRISAQKSLEFREKYTLTSYEDAIKAVWYGENSNGSSKGHRWGWDEERYVKPLADCNTTMQAFFAQKNKDDEARAKQASESCKSQEPVKVLAPSIAEQLEQIWNKILPQRNLLISDLKIKATKNGSTPYEARFMSDGERDVLYYLATCLCLPKNIFVILDEPENHIHNSIINKLFNALEQARPDLTFIYVTHNLEFAAEHANSKKLWFKDYDGENWNYLLLNDEYELPEELLLEVLGVREKILLVEGTKNSLDTKLYQAYYKNYKVIGCEGCQQVINRVRAFNSHTLSSHYDVQGIVDRDYRTDEELSDLQKDKIYTCEVAEVENLFLIPEVLNFAAKKIGTHAEVEACMEILAKKYAYDLSFQIVAAVNSEVKYQISKLGLSKRNLNVYKSELENLKESIGLEAIILEAEAKFTKPKNEHNYEAILKVYNQKGLICCIVKALGYATKEIFYDNVVAGIKSGDEELISGLSKYLPALP